MRSISRSATILCAGAVLAGASVASGATVIRYYDVNNPLSRVGNTLLDISGNGGATLTASQGLARNSSPGGLFTSADFGTPVFVPNGAGAGNRAYFDFQQFGVITGSNLDANGLGGPGVQGYALEGYFLMESTHRATVNSALGSSHGTGGENQVIYFSGMEQIGNVRSGRSSNSETDLAAGGDQNLVQINTDIDSILPLDQWFHYIKVHDPVNEVVRFYVNGQLALTVPFVENGVEYHAFGEGYGNTGAFGRELRDVGYSMTRFWKGPLNDYEANYRFLEVQGLPEPTIASLIALPGLFLLRRRGQQHSDIG